MLTKIFEILIDFIYPPTELEKILKSIKTTDVYNKCLKTNMENLNIFSIFKYKDPFIKDSITELKKNKNKYAIKIFGEILLDYILIFIEENLFQTDYKIPIVFIPQHKSTFQDKGFNQGEELIDFIVTSKPDILEKKNILEKYKKTKAQHEIKNKKERLKNIKDTFRIKPASINHIKNKIVFIIDDVTTTGATLKEASQQIQNAGASQIFCFTIAH